MTTDAAPTLLIKEGGRRVHPAPEEEMAEGDALVVMGKTEDIQALEQSWPGGLPPPPASSALPIPA